MIAVPEDGRIAVYGSIQCPYYVHKALVAAGRPVTRVRVVQTETGGGFGGKEEYPSMLAGHAALLALKAGRPVKIVYDRVEDMVATTKRHPVDRAAPHRRPKDGRLVAMEIDVLMDGGAYVTLCPVVLSRGVIHAAGPYRCDHMTRSGRVVMTNTPPNGAFRGFGAPQTEFAIEVHMERIAERSGWIRCGCGSGTRCGPATPRPRASVLGEDCSALQVLREAVAEIGYRAQAARRTPARTGGSALALLPRRRLHRQRGAQARLARLGGADRDRRRDPHLQHRDRAGHRTMHAQIVADALGIPYESVEVAQPDTSVVPDSGPTVASRTCMVVGGILERCAHEMRERLAAAPRGVLRAHGPLTVTGQYEPPRLDPVGRGAYRGDAYATYGWGCDVAESSSIRTPTRCATPRG